MPGDFIILTLLAGEAVYRIGVKIVKRKWKVIEFVESNRFCERLLKDTSKIVALGGEKKTSFRSLHIFSHICIRDDRLIESTRYTRGGRKKKLLHSVRTVKYTFQRRLSLGSAHFLTEESTVCLRRRTYECV